MKALRVLSLLVFSFAFFALALPTAADCPAGDPAPPLTPPISHQVSSDSATGDFTTGELSAPGALAPLDFTVPPPVTVDPLPFLEPSEAPTAFEALPVRVRLQDPSDVSCGVQALGMALEGLGGGAPASSALTGFLQGNGMMYDFGTGVEELAHAAQSFGYKGSLPFHGASLEDLAAEVGEGRPVVVSLGANGEGQPGHFVTVTGISPDGEWVSYNDPTLGAQVISADAFKALWARQGSSGVVVRKTAPEAGDIDYAPWVALVAAGMALVATSPFGKLREGVGGRLDVGGAGSSPPYRAPPGYRWVRSSVPRYDIRYVQDGWTYTTKREPQYERRRVQTGWTTVYDKIPKYKTVQVQDGWKTVTERVPRYRNVRYVRYYRTVRERRPTYRYIRGRRIFAGYRTITKRVPVYGTRRVQAGWTVRSKRVPNMVSKRVFAGYDIKATQVPKYEWRNVQTGFTLTTERTPNMVWKRVQVGTEPKWTLVHAPTPPTTIPTGTPAPSPSSTPTPSPTPQPTQEIVRAPYPPGFVPFEEEWPEIETEGKWVARGLRAVRSISNALTASALQFNALDSGEIGVKVSPQIPAGQRAQFRQGYGFAGTRYSPSTITRITGRQLVKGALSKVTWITALATSAIGNVIDYGFGKNKEKGILSQEFAVSTGVDTVMAVGTGLIAAGTVALFAAALPITLSVTTAILATAAVGAIFGIVSDQLGIGEKAKEVVNNAIDSIEDDVDRFVEDATSTVQNIGATISGALSGATSFLGSIFGGSG